MRRLAPLTALVLTLCLGFAATAFAQATGTGPDGEEDDGRGSISGSDAPLLQRNVELVGSAAVNGIGDGRVADVGAFGNYAYLGAFREPECTNRGGVYVVDIADPTAPEQVGFISTTRGAYVGEGVQVFDIQTDAYSGPVLLHQNELCDGSGTGLAGASLWDVSDPLVPRPLALHFGDLTIDGETSTVVHPDTGEEVPYVNQSHSIFAWSATEADPETGEDVAKVYAIMVDNEETEDLDVFDISDPTAPVQVAGYDLNAQFPEILQPELGDAESFSHDMVVKEVNGRQVLLQSYWDGGYVTLDVTDVTAPEYIGDSDFTDPDPEAAESGFDVPPEGNAHQAEFSFENDFILTADEDFAPYSPVATNTTDGTEFPADIPADTPGIEPGNALTGTTVFVGRACPSEDDPAVPPAGEGTIAIVERGVCTFTEKVAAVEAAGGYEGVLIVNNQGPGRCSSTGGAAVEAGIAVLAILGREVAFDLLNLPYDEASCAAGQNPITAPIGTLGDAISVEQVFDGWGYVHLYDNRTGKLRELDTYAIPEAHDPAFATGFGDLSVHEVAVDPAADRAYISYYAGGFRVVDFGAEGVEEVGAYIAQGGSNYWGVQVHTIPATGEQVVLASDRDKGLDIFRYAPGAGGPDPVRRVAGDDRVRTAVALAQEAFPAGAETVLLARADDYPDALAGGPLATTLGGPILLTGSAQLDGAAADEIARLGAEQVVLLGGEAALADQVAEDVADFTGAAVRRVSGSDRFATAAAIAAEVGGDAAFLVEGGNDNPGRGWPDALSVSPVASVTGRPILLATATDLPDATAAALAAYETVTVVGGRVAVGEDVLEQVEDQAERVDRVAGADRYATAVAVAARGADAGLTPAPLYLATGTSFADALVAGPVAAADGSVLLLTDPADIADSPATAAYVERTSASGELQGVVLVGGLEAIGDRVARQVRAAQEPDLPAKAVDPASAYRQGNPYCLLRTQRNAGDTGPTPTTAVRR